MKLKKDFTIYNIADEWMLIPTGEQIATFGGTVVLNEVAAFLVKEIKDDDKTIDQLMEALLNEYDVDATTARNDISEALETLKQSGVLED